MAVIHEQSQNHSKSTQYHYLKIYAKLPLHIKVALTEFHIFIVRDGNIHVNTSFQTHNMLCKQNN